MKKYLLALLLPMLCVGSNAQEKLFNDAIARGRTSGSYYKLVNTGGKPLSLDKLKEFAQEKGYLLGSSTTKSISRFGDVSEVIATLEFLPKSEYPSLLFEKISNTSTLKLASLKNTGTGYIFMPNTSKNTYFWKDENIKWSGELNGSMIHGQGTGFIGGDEKVYVCFTGKFENGMPQGTVEYRFYTVKDKNEIYNAANLSTNKTTVGQFYENLASFEYSNYYGFVNRKGETVISPQYKSVVKNFENGRATVVTNNGSNVYIDTKGKLYKNELYSTYAKRFVEERLKTWQAKDPYETLDEYKARVTEETRQAKAKDLLALAEKEYIKLYTKDVQLSSSLKLRPYDAENGAFLVESDYGELIVPVPRTDNEARDFERSWSQLSLSDAKYYISNDKVFLSDLTFTTPDGKSYHSAADKSLNYTETEVDVRFEALDNSLFATTGKENKSKVNRQKQSASIGKSDVDVDIPETQLKNDHTFAIIICNENYDKIAGVPLAVNDGNTFAQYCKKTLGLPETNVKIYEDATFLNMRQALDKIEEIASIFQGQQGDFNVIFYYAGHGIPDEATKDCFLLPIDSDGKNTKYCLSQKDLYERLGGLGAKSVVVFQDACFSGANRGDGMIVAARGVAVKAKAAAPEGNMVIFTAASGEETAMPYTEKGHGLFTYYLLKKLQDSKGDVTLSELGNYIKSEVLRQSVLVNDKKQTPSIQASLPLKDTWGSMKLGN